MCGPLFSLSLSLSFRFPLLSVLCRASTCSHLQCFDASLYLQMNERKPTWNCPVCDKSAIYESLVIDGYFQDVLNSPILSSDTNEIQLNKDGSWSTHVMSNDAQSLDTPCKRFSNVEIISDDVGMLLCVRCICLTLNAHRSHIRFQR